MTLGEGTERAQHIIMEAAMDTPLFASLVGSFFGALFSFLFMVVLMMLQNVRDRYVRGFNAMVNLSLSFHRALESLGVNRDQVLKRQETAPEVPMPWFEPISTREEGITELLVIKDTHEIQHLHVKTRELNDRIRGYTRLYEMWMTNMAQATPSAEKDSVFKQGMEQLITQIDIRNNEIIKLTSRTLATLNCRIIIGKPKFYHFWKSLDVTEEAIEKENARVKQEANLQDL